MQITLLGTGTSFGVPVIGCSCHVCKSQSQKDKRLRCSVLVCQKEEDKTTTNILVDVSPEFRLQALKYGIKSLSSVLLTHSHADHLHGLDDIRIFSHQKGKKTNPTSSLMHKKQHPDQLSFPENAGEGLRLFANTNTLQDVKNRFDYIFEPYIEGGGIPKLHLEDVTKYTPKNPLKIGSIEVLPVPLIHGHTKDSGYIFTITRQGKRHSFAYLTDCNYVPQSSIDMMNDMTRNEGTCIEHCVIDALRVTPHSTHFCFKEAYNCAKQIGAKNIWFTHICHDCSHEEIISYIEQNIDAKGNVAPAYDGLVLNV